MTRTGLVLPLLALSLSFLANAAFQSGKQCESARYENKPRVFIMTDISNEPDDQMSLVRLLTHSNELDIVNIACVTSVWKNSSLDTQSIFNVISGYGQVITNLDANVPDAGKYPSAEQVAGSVVTGHPVYGLAALEEATPSNASTALIKAVDDSSDDKPLWALAWGGANVLAEALNQVKQSRSDDDVVTFVRKLRVYAISDQDNSGVWIRENFPQLFYIVSLHGFSEYTLASWNGISGEEWRNFDQGGPDSSIVSNDWLQEHIRIGPLGSHYLNWTFIMEGDTPSFLGILPNGLNVPEHPEYGGWGGRFILLDASGKTSRTFTDTTDWVVGLNGVQFTSKFATIWRWRHAYQFEFANRMQWTIASPAANTTNNDAQTQLNHHPVVVVNDTCGFDTLEVPYTFGESVVLDASKSYDPDNDELSFDWSHYREPSMRLEGKVPKVSPNVTFTPLDEKKTGSLVEIKPNNNLTLHILLTLQDVKPMNLTSYKRIILMPQ